MVKEYLFSAKMDLIMKELGKMITCGDMVDWSPRTLTMRVRSQEV